MPTTREWYARVNAAWPDSVPALTGWEAVRAASRLWRWARGSACPFEIRETSGNRYTYQRGGVLWVNPERGWKELIHDLSHTVDLESKAHGRHHAKLELRMIREVLKRGYLDGRLKKLDEPAPTAKPDPRAVKLSRIETRIANWQAKLRRAETALKKLNRQQRYYARVVKAETRAL